MKENREKTIMTVIQYRLENNNLTEDITQTLSLAIQTCAHIYRTQIHIVIILFTLINIYIYIYSDGDIFD